MTTTTTTTTTTAKATTTTTTMRMMANDYDHPQDHNECNCNNDKKKSNMPTSISILNQGLTTVTMTSCKTDVLWDHNCDHDHSEPNSSLVIRPRLLWAVKTHILQFSSSSGTSWYSSFKPDHPILLDTHPTLLHLLCSALGSHAASEIPHILQTALPAPSPPVSGQSSPWLLCIPGLPLVPRLATTLISIYISCNHNLSTREEVPTFPLTVLTSELSVAHPHVPESSARVRGLCTINPTLSRPRWPTLASNTFRGNVHSHLRPPATTFPHLRSCASRTYPRP